MDPFSSVVFGSASFLFTLAGFPHRDVMHPIVIHARRMPNPFPFVFHDGCQQLGEFGFILYCIVQYLILPVDV